MASVMPTENEMGRVTFSIPNHILSYGKEARKPYYLATARSLLQHCLYESNYKFFFSYFVSELMMDYSIL
jgi:hypothetical protein